jgi:hypothetical protein
MELSPAITIASRPIVKEQKKIFLDREPAIQIVGHGKQLQENN